MQNSSSFSWWKRLILAAIGLNFLAFVFPQKDDLVELKGFLYGRNEAKFRNIDKNLTSVLVPGTRGIVAKTQYFPATKNYGVCLTIMNATNISPSEECTWIYYDIKNPNMNLYATSQSAALKEETLKRWAQDKEQGQNLVKAQILRKVSTPATGLAAQTTRPVTGIVENKAPITAPTPPMATPAPSFSNVQSGTGAVDTATQKVQVDAEAALKTALANVSQYNNNAGKAMTPATCVECALKLESYATCNSKNDYMESELSRILNGSKLSPVLAGDQHEIIRKACVQRSLDTYPNLRDAFKNCQPDDQRHRGSVGKACVSKNYVDITTNSFNAAAECLADYVSGNPETMKETSLAIFELTSWESGMHVNAQSPTGAAGVGMLVDGAVSDINSRLKLIRNHVSNSKNPNCNKKVVLDVLNSPIRTGRSQSCDRLGISKDNPLKNMLYTFAYQASSRRFLEAQVLNSKIFAGTISQDLPASEKERLTSSVAIWSHNTGPAGMKVPLQALMMQYLAKRKSVKTTADVDQFLQDLQLALVKYPHQANARRARLLETSTFFGKIQERVSRITKEPRQCLAD